MPSLSVAQFQIVYNVFSFTFAAMFAAFIFAVMARQQLAPQYRAAMIMSALVVGVAGYHYLRIFESWNAAFTLQGGMYVSSGKPFNDAYRYVDWLLTVPLLIAELVFVINPLNRGRLTFTLATAAALMVILGYPGEVASSMGTRALWGFLSTIPFLYIVWKLFAGLGTSMNEQPTSVRVLIRNTRWLLLATWGFYPIVYLLPILGVTDTAAIIAVQVGYCIADVAAKAGYGLMIYAIASEKSKVAGWKYGATELSKPAA